MSDIEKISKEGTRTDMSRAEKRIEKERKRRREAGVFASLTGAFGMVLIIGVLLIMIPMFAPRIMGFGAYEVVSGSMEPEIPIGSLVLVREADPGNIAEGEVIAFLKPDDESLVITHRVVQNDKENEQFVTKGDANKVQDNAPVPYKNLIGRVEHHFPKVGGIIAGLSSFDGKLLLMCILSAGVLLNYLSGRLRR